MSKYDDLVKKLKEIFQIDRPELDFGIYRILGSKSKEINRYLEIDLKTKAESSLLSRSGDDLRLLQRELDEKIDQYIADGIDPDTVPKIIGLRVAISQKGVSVDIENEVYSHLLTFFSRYFDRGDFISKRRYKGDTYSIPYSGEEVILYWANGDQYYTKSGENFSNFSFKLSDGRTVTFRLISAETSKDNRKDSDKDRRFILFDGRPLIRRDEDGVEYEEVAPHFYEINSLGKDELVINFEYKTVSKVVKQDDLIAEAVKSVLSSEIVRVRWAELASREPTEKNPNRTLLEKCFITYVSKNNSDYFIHKNLKKFLTNELDFYIKNEIMLLDDMQDTNDASIIGKKLSLIQTIRSIAGDIISFLGQLEDFQKRIWLKTKFVVSSNYCISLDQLPQELYAEIISNNAQINQWINLGMIESSNEARDLLSGTQVVDVDFLKQHPKLMLDTGLFGGDFKYRVLSHIENLDKSIGGVLINSDNFQALKLLSEKYRAKIRTVYIDPPYNTSASEIIYKNNYKHSSWLSLISSRLALAKDLMADDGFIACAIDDLEVSKLQELMDQQIGFENRVGNTIVVQNPGGRHDDKFIATAHEYCLYYSKDAEKAVSNLLPLEESDIDSFKLKDSLGFYRTREFRRSGNNSTRESRPLMYYPIFLKQGDICLITEQEFSDIYNKKTGVFNDLWVGELQKKYEGLGYKMLLPIDPNSIKRVWRWGLETLKAKLSEVVVSEDRSGQLQIKVKDRLDNKEGLKPKSIWNKPKYAGANGTNLLKNLFGADNKFSYPKALPTVEDSLRIISNKDSTVLDFFAGSGTTGHAVISLNKGDGGERKFILVEQGEYFDQVTKPRIQKVCYSLEWVDGKPVDQTTGTSFIFKYMSLESYEDSLNNIEFIVTDEQKQLLSDLPKSIKDDYLINYFIEEECKESLLSVNDFINPFNYKLKIAVDSSGAYEWRQIDLIETFNYLMGIEIKHIDSQVDLGFVAVSGILPNREKVLVLWRDVEKLDYSALQEVCKKMAINPSDDEFDVVYINGDHNLPTAFTTLEQEGGVTRSLKIRPIDSEFLRRMFFMGTH